MAISGGGSAGREKEEGMEVVRVKGWQEGYIGRRKSSRAVRGWDAWLASRARCGAQRAMQRGDGDGDAARGAGTAQWRRGAGDGGSAAAIALRGDA